jgi:hypothetical protein
MASSGGRRGSQPGHAGGAGRAGRAAWKEEGDWKKEWSNIFKYAFLVSGLRECFLTCKSRFSACIHAYGGFMV